MKPPEHKPADVVYASEQELPQCHSTGSQLRRNIRPYHPCDREAVRRICCDTGFLGQPIDPIFQDRELFADFLTSYYTDAEPESSFIIEVNGAVGGYLLGSRNHARREKFERQLLPKIALRAAHRLLSGRYNSATRSYLMWLITRGWRETPRAPKHVPHFHINLLPQARSVPDTYRLIQSFLNYLVAAGEKSVFGQMVVFDGKRGPRMFARYGWTILNKSEITKYRQHYPEPVFLYTVMKDLTANADLYGLDLQKKQIHV